MADAHYDGVETWGVSCNSVLNPSCFQCISIGTEKFAWNAV